MYYKTQNNKQTRVCAGIQSTYYKRTQCVKLVSHLQPNNYLPKSTAGSQNGRLLVKPLDQIL